MRKTFAAILAITSVLWFSTVQTKTIYKDIKPATFESLNKKQKIQVECLAQNIFFEAGNESFTGQVAVGLVTLNRVNSNEHPSTICGVVQESTIKDDDKVCQFTWWCDDYLKTKAQTHRYTTAEKQRYLQIRKVALYTFMNYAYITDVTHGAMFYHATYVNPKWKLKKTVQIGNHIFYRKV